MKWRIVRNGLIAAIIASILCGFIWLYDTALRDSRMLDGWILFAAMTLQVLLGLRKKFPRLPAGQVTVWMQAHIYCGYVIVTIFAIHTQATLPDTAFEWALWLPFILVAASGTIGAFLMRSIPARLDAKSYQVPLEHISMRQAEIAREVDDLVVGSAGGTGAAAFVGLYTRTLHAFFRKPRNVLAHLRQSKRPLRAICGELDAFDRYLDSPGKETLRSIKTRIIAKNDLDYQYAHQGLLVIWLFIHIPATYGLIVLTIMHVAIVHAHSSGV